MPGHVKVGILHGCDCDLLTVSKTLAKHGNKTAVKPKVGMQGYNAAIIAYGQTGTGKTFTMEGAHSGPSRGIIPRAIEDVFMYIENDRNAAQSKFLVRASYLQIYNEVRSHACMSAYIDM